MIIKYPNIPSILIGLNVILHSLSFFLRRQLCKQLECNALLKAYLTELCRKNRNNRSIMVRIELDINKPTFRFIPAPEKYRDRLTVCCNRMKNIQSKMLNGSSGCEMLSIGAEKKMSENRREEKFRSELLQLSHDEGCCV